MFSAKRLYFYLIFLSLFYLHSSFASVTSNHDSKYYSVNVCNLAPYPVIINAATSINGEFIFSDIVLEAGQCETVAKNERILGEPSVHLNAYPSPDDPAIQYLKNEQWFKEAWEKIGTKQTYGAASGSVIFCIAKDDFSKIRKVESIHDRRPNEILRFYSPPIKIADSGIGDWIILDPAICSKVTEIDFNSNLVSIDELSNWAKGLYHAIKRLDFINAHYQTQELIFPSQPGLRLMDTNGMFDLGLEVKEALESTPLGVPIHLQKGDKILFFNGVSVFGRDILKLFYDAGKKYGYNHANELFFLRNGELHKTSITLFFDEDLWGSVFRDSERLSGSPLVASILSACHEYTFYSQNIITCLIESKKNETWKYSDYDECKFQRDQILAAYKQFHPKAYFTGEIVGGVTFIGRSLIKKMVIKNVPLLGGKSIYSRVIRAAVLETAEEGVRAIFTSPPGSSTKALLENMKERAKLQGVIGVGFQVSPLATSVVMGPILWDSYKNL